MIKFFFLDIKFHQYGLMISLGKFHENVITFYGGKIQKIPFSVVFLLKTAILHL